MSIISKIGEAFTILNTVVAFAEKVKTILGVTDNDDLAAKLAQAEVVLTATQEALGTASPAA